MARQANGSLQCMYMVVEWIVDELDRNVEGLTFLQSTVKTGRGGRG